MVELRFRSSDEASGLGSDSGTTRLRFLLGTYAIRDDLPPASADLLDESFSETFSRCHCFEPQKSTEDTKMRAAVLALELVFSFCVFCALSWLAKTREHMRWLAAPVGTLPEFGNHRW